jgi:hypothetical protein
MLSIPIVSSFNDRGVSNAKKSFKELEGVAAKSKFAFQKAGFGATLAIGLIAKGMQSAISAASDLAESVNAVEVTFGKASAEILKLSETASDAFGLSQKDFNGLAVQFASFAKTIAGKGGNVANVLEDIAGRAADFASVMNLDVADAAAKFQSGLAGEAEPLKKFGIDLSDSAIKAYALANNIGEVEGKLTENEKVLARYGSLMEQTSNFSGDFANTSDSAANAQKTLKAKVEDTKAAIGKSLKPILEKVLPVLEDFAKWAEDNPGAFQAIAAAIGAVALAITAVNIAMSLNPFTLIAAGIALLIVGVVAAYKKFEGFRNVVDTIGRALKTGFLAALEAIKLAVEAVGKVFKTLFNGIAKLWNNTFGKISFKVPSWVPVIGGKGFDVPDIPLLAAGGIVTGPTLAMIGEAGPEAVVPLSRAGEFGMGGGGVNITIQTGVGDPVAIGREVRRVMDAYGRRSA